MENPATGGAPFCQASRRDSTEFTRKIQNSQAACRAISAGLACLARPQDVAFVFRRRLDLGERFWLSTAAVMSLPADDAEELAEATLADIERHRLTPNELEAERQRRAWMRYCAARTPYERRRRARS